VGVEAGAPAADVMFAISARLDALSAKLVRGLREVIAAYHRARHRNRRPGSMALVAKYMGDGVWSFGYREHMRRCERAGSGQAGCLGRLSAASMFNPPSSRRASGSPPAGGRRRLIGAGSAQSNRPSANPEPRRPAASPRRAGRGRHRREHAPAGRDLFEYRDSAHVRGEGQLPRRCGLGRCCARVSSRSRFRALRGSEWTRLSAATRENRLLRRRWARAKAGDGQVVLISGEPGLGKSRLAGGIGGAPRGEPYLRLRYFCSPISRTVAFTRSSTSSVGQRGFARDDPPGARLESSKPCSPAQHHPDEDVAFLRRPAVIAGFGTPAPAQPQSAAQRSGRWRR